MTPKKMTFTLENDTEETIERPTRTPPLATRIPTARKRDFLTRPDGMTDVEARQRAQGEVNRSFDQVVTASGTLNALRYGRILQPRRLVDVRGAGEHYDGSYYVKSVTHKIDISKGEYKQTFELTREGVGTTTPFVST
jgi:phage protein D